jgi:hypothetical protein
VPEWLAEFSRAYYVPLIDYAPPAGVARGDWLLIGSGCGVMMGVMDQVPRIRWCVDLDDVKDKSRFARWMGWAENFVGLVAIAGWFSLSDPTPLREGIAQLKRRPAIYTPFVELGEPADRSSTLQAYLDRLGRIGLEREHRDLALHR